MSAHRSLKKSLESAYLFGAHMKNVDMKVEGDTLVIKVDLTKEFGPSSSGKTIIVCSTEGNQSIDYEKAGKGGYKIGLNVYRKP